MSTLIIQTNQYNANKKNWEKKIGEKIRDVGKKNAWSLCFSDY